MIWRTLDVERIESRSDRARTFLNTIPPLDAFEHHGYVVLCKAMFSLLSDAIVLPFVERKRFEKIHSTTDHEKKDVDIWRYYRLLVFHYESRQYNFNFSSIVLKLVQVGANDHPEPNLPLGVSYGAAVSVLE